MRSRAVAPLSLLLGASLLAQTQPPPIFRSNIEVVRLDVTVLDEQRHPVPGLTQGDFTILVDGVPQPIVAFEPVVIPRAAPPTTEWMREVAPDVRTNALGEPRLFVILMDDATTPTDPFMVNTAKKIAHRVIDEMSPSDLAAVVFTMDNSDAQDFTSDPRLLRAAVEHFNFGMRGNPLGARYSQKALGDAIKFLRERGHGRSAVILLTVSPVGSKNVTANAFETPLSVAARALEDLQLSADVEALGGASRFMPVPIYGFNIAGLVAPNAGAAAQRSNVPIPFAERPYTFEEMQMSNDAFRTLADMTGGRAIVNDNDPARMVPAVLEEMSAYYTIAYRATYPLDDRRQRHLRIRVDRDKVIVLPSDRLLYAGSPPKKSSAPPPGPLLKAISDIVPTSNMAMEVTVAPFPFIQERPPKRPSAGVLTTLRVKRIAPPDRSSDEIQVLAKVFTPEGKQVASIQQKAALRLRPSDRDAEIDVLTPIALEPGRYNVRFSAHSVGLGKTGSVYTDVTVPDFSRARLSLSGVLISATPAATAAPKEAFAKYVPVVPTSGRAFASGDRASAFLRAYQRVKNPVPVDVSIRVVDSQGKDVATKTERLAADRFASGVGVDVTYDVPLNDLPPGSYLLTIAATLDAKTNSRRDVRFLVR